MNTPRSYMPRMSLLWWLERPNYVRYMLRELTCVFIGSYVGVLIVGLFRLSQGSEAWDAYWTAVSSVPGIIFQVLVLVSSLYHTVTWFALAPSTMPIRFGQFRVPAGWIQAAHYLAWIIMSVVVMLLARI